MSIPSASVIVDRFDLIDRSVVRRKESARMGLKLACSGYTDRGCCWCGRGLSSDPASGNGRTREHLMPLSLGGRDTPSNIAIACAKCNNERGSDTGPPRSKCADGAGWATVAWREGRAFWLDFAERTPGKRSGAPPLGRRSRRARMCSP